MTKQGGLTDTVDQPASVPDAHGTVEVQDDVSNLATLTATSPQQVPGLPDGVAANIRRRVPRRADRLLTHLRTAAALLQLQLADPLLRLPESVAYNIRETLDSVVHDADAGVGGLGNVHAAWEEVEAARKVSDDDGAAVAHLLAVVKASADAKLRENYSARKFIAQIRNSTGVTPFDSSIARFNALRQNAAASLHSAMTLADAETLYRDTVAWLTWMFTPPDQRAADIAALAAEPYTEPEQLDRVRELCSNPLQLGRFLTLITDPSWLKPLHDAGIIALPVPDDPGPWPVQQLTLGSEHPEPVADMLGWLAEDLKKLPKPQRPVPAFSLLRECVDGGAQALNVADKLLSTYGPNYPGFRGLGIELARRCDPRHPLVERAARLALQPDDLRRHHHADPVLRALAAGVTPDNAETRVKLIAYALKNLHEANPYLVMDRVPLGADPGRTSDEHRRVAHYLIRVADAARSHGVTTTQLLDWTTPVPGPAGQRLTSALLINAADTDPSAKIAHIATRFNADPTGDDRDLISDIFRTNDPEVTNAAVTAWTTALGQPATDGGEPVDPDDFGTPEADVWRWSSLLPTECTAAWGAAIAPLVAKHSHLDPAGFDAPREHVAWRFHDEASPFTADELADASGVDAADRVNAWQPAADDSDPANTRRAVAHVFEQATERRLSDWLLQADTIVNTLADPLYIAHFLRAATQSTTTLAPAAAPVTAMLTTVVTNLTTGKWPGITDQLRTSLTNHVLDITTHLGDTRAVTTTGPAFTTLWDYAATTALTHTDNYTPIGEVLDDPTGLTAAINEPAGRATLAVLALAANHYRANNTSPPQLTDFLKLTTDFTGATAPYVQAILLSRYALLDALAPDWLDDNQEQFLPPGETGDNAAFAIISRNHPTPALLTRLHDQVHALTKQHPEPCVTWLLAGAIRNHPGYTITDAINTIAGNVTAAEELCQQSAFLVQDEPADSPALAAAVTVWQAILNSKLSREALPKLGHWAFVTNINADDYIPLMHDTLTATGGAIDNPTDVAERWTVGQPAASLPTLHLLLGHGDPWEQIMVAATALNCLQAAAAHNLTPMQLNAFNTLRAALIDRGNYAAEQITTSPKNPA